ncbi:MAG: hypothetical protein A2X12_06570 [Bacteroidetes bacterium GWE2_29_8]|nr:MAG: hypothetical protein A2X12_06570 [Bacteroidetes bacterium GWE2_29_8]
MYRFEGYRSGEDEKIEKVVSKNIKEMLDAYELFDINEYDHYTITDLLTDEIVEEDMFEKYDSYKDGTMDLLFPDKSTREGIDSNDSWEE